jgi:hypothetical protein
MQRVRSYRNGSAGLEHTFVEHFTGTVKPFLAGLEHEDHGAPKASRPSRKEVRRTNEHGGVHVVATGVHVPISLRPECHIARF